MGGSFHVGVIGDIGAVKDPSFILRVEDPLEERRDCNDSILFISTIPCVSQCFRESTSMPLSRCSGLGEISWAGLSIAERCIGLEEAMLIFWFMDILIFSNSLLLVGICITRVDAKELDF